MRHIIEHATKTMVHFVYDEMPAKQKHSI